MEDLVNFPCIFDYLCDSPKKATFYGYWQDERNFRHVAHKINGLINLPKTEGERYSNLLAIMQKPDTLTIAPGLPFRLKQDEKSVRFLISAMMRQKERRQYSKVLLVSENMHPLLEDISNVTSLDFITKQQGYGDDIQLFTCLSHASNL